MANDELLAGIAGALGGIRDVALPFIETKFKSKLQRELEREKFSREAYINPSDLPDELRTRIGVDKPIRKEVLDLYKSQGYTYDADGNLVPLGYGARVSGVRPKQEAPDRPLKTDEQLRAEAAAGVKYPANAPPIRVSDENKTPKLSEEDKVFQRERAKQMAKRGQAITATTDAIANLRKMRKEAEDILNDSSLSIGTGITSPLGYIPGTGAKRVQARVKTLASQTGFSVLQAMRESSKTGGALGQISDKENELLQANISSLDLQQSTEDFANSLKRVAQYTIDAENRLKKGYENTYGEPFGGGEQSAGVPKVGDTFEGKKVKSIRRVK